MWSSAKRQLKILIHSIGYDIISTKHNINHEERQTLFNKFGHKSDVSFVGPYLIHNFGDDLIGATLAASFKKSGRRSSIPGLALGNSEWLESIPHSITEESVNNSEHILIGGGHLFGEGGSKNFNHLNIYLNEAWKAAKLAKAQRKQVAVTAVGAGPLSDPSAIELTQRICSYAQFIGVRDQDSAEFLTGEIGVGKERITVGADAALVWPNYLDIQPQPNNLIGIQFDPQMFIAEEKSEKILDLISEFSKTNRKNICFISNSIRNTFASQYCGVLAPNLNYRLLPEFLKHLSGLRVIFTSHLHLAIAAYACRVPCFSVYANEKTKRFYKQIGRSDRAIDLQKSSLDEIQALLNQAQTASWEEFDEQNLSSLIVNAEKILHFDTIFN